MQNQSDCLSISDVAGQLKVSRDKLYSLLKRYDGEKQFRASGVVGDKNAIFYPREEWDKFLASTGQGYS